jgi:hypothetical protein
MMRILYIICCLLFVAVTGVSAEGERNPIGLVKTATDAFILRGGSRIAAYPGFQLVKGDVLSTGAKGSMGVVLRDDTTLSLSSSTETTVEQFDFEPAEQRLGMVLRVAHGIIGYLSGKISKLAPGSVRLETPTATLGVRGTHLVARIIP